MSQFYKILFCLLLSYSSIFSQKMEWMAMTHCGYLARAKYIDTDQTGACYIFGDMRGEIIFESADNSGDSHRDYTSQHWMKSFMAKYSNSGQLDYVITLKNRMSNSDLVYPHGIKCLANGDFAILVSAGYDFYIDTPFGMDTVSTNGRRTKLLRFSQQGRFLWSAEIKTEYSDKILEDSSGNLYVDTKTSYITKRSFVKLDYNGKELDQLPHELKNMKKVTLIDDKIWWVTITQSEPISLYSSQGPGTVRLGTIDLNSSEVKVECEIPVSVFDRTRMDLSTVDGNVELNIWTQLKTQGFQYKDRTFSSEESDLLLKVDRQGNILRHAYTPRAFYYNTNLFSGNDGSVYLISPAKDTLHAEGFEPIYNPTPHSSVYIQELYLFKYDSNLEPRWVVNGGGTSSNYHHSHVSVTRENEVFFISDLLDYGEFLGQYKELKWKSGLYSMKIQD